MKFCPQCGQRLSGIDSEKQRYTPKPEAPLKEMNWFERHLNWTMVLAWLSTYPIAFLVGSIVIGIAPYISGDAVWGITVIISLIVTIVVGQWVLKKRIGACGGY